MAHLKSIFNKSPKTSDPPQNVFVAKRITSIKLKEKTPEEIEKELWEAKKRHNSRRSEHAKIKEYNDDIKNYICYMI